MWRSFRKFSVAGIIAISLIGLLVTGCSENDLDVSESNAAVKPAETVDPNARPALSPMQEYLRPIIGFGFSPQEQQQIAMQRRVALQDSIATCMRERGFDYIPNLAIGDQTAPLTNDPWLRDDPSWVAQWGYGIFKPTREPGSSYIVPFESPDDFTEDDPNFAIYSALSEGEQLAYMEALWGWYQDERWENLSLDGSRGCIGQARAMQESTSPSSIFSFENPEFAPLFGAWFDMLMESNINAIDADVEWSHCMADAGFPDLKTPNDAQSLIWAEIPMRWYRQPSGNFDLSLIDDESEAAAIRAHEIEVAQADLDCRLAINYQERRDAHTLAVETQWVEDWRAELEALRDAAEQRGTTWDDYLN